MASITLDRLTKKFGKQTAVKDLTLEIHENEFVAILGPSGCGKTTTMNMISGLLMPDNGKVYFDGREMNDVPAGKRGVGFVFQNYAVFTHMTVYNNIACGLKVRKFSASEIDREVKKAAELLQIEQVLNTNAGRLSINDMQKVALARTLVTKPEILLLDEPLSNLDASLRNVMRAELKRFHHELGQTTVYVTHDQVEAMSLADRIAVMNFAVLQQYDTPHEVYSRPKNLFVANFIGSPTMNFLKGAYREGQIHLKDFDQGIIPISNTCRATLEKGLKNAEVVLGIRPEHLKLDGTDGTQKLLLKAQVVSLEPLGSETIVYLKPQGGADNIIKSMMHSDYVVNVNEVKALAFKEEDLYIFDQDSGDLVITF
jgi:multiple sugar transport system ATP-binding protein